tara:strand:- start:26 stop:355 length:330 start_codon:yes stop_codon:yes gene_type:complete
VHGPEFVHVRKDGPDTLGVRLELLIAKERIQPDQTAAGTMESIHGRSQTLSPFPVQPVGDQENHRSLPQHPSRPGVVELLDTGPDACAAVPVLHHILQTLQGHVSITMA